MPSRARPDCSRPTRLLPQTLAFVAASATELTRTGKMNELVSALAGDEDDEAEPPPLPWEWGRVGHDTVANFTRDAGSQTLTRCVERLAKPKVGAPSYCELLKHAHRLACKEYHDAKGACTAVSASAKAARAVALSPRARLPRLPPPPSPLPIRTRPRTRAHSRPAAPLAPPVFYAVRSLTCWVADVFVDSVAYLRGHLYHTWCTPTPCTSH